MAKKIRGFDTMSKNERKKASKKGVEARRNKKKTFTDVVEEQTDYETLLGIYKGVVASAKKGNVNAVETILQHLAIKKNEKAKAEEEKKSKFKL